MREMIVAEHREERIQALNKLLPMQREDFVGLFKVMKGLPVTIRLLDLHCMSFLPHTSEETAEIAARLKWSEEKIGT